MHGFGLNFNGSARARNPVGRRGKDCESVGAKRDGVTCRLGCFRDELAAAQAYDEAARELFGEHAQLNFPDGIDAWPERETAPATAADAAAADEVGAPDMARAA